MKWSEVTAEDKERVIRLLLGGECNSIEELAQRASVPEVVAAELVHRIYMRYLESKNSPKRKRYAQSSQRNDGAEEKSGCSLAAQDGNK